MRLRTILSLAAAGHCSTPACSGGRRLSHTSSPPVKHSSVAAADGLSVGQLAAANGISPYTEIVSGTTLLIPPQGSGVVSEADAGSKRPPPRFDGDDRDDRRRRAPHRDDRDFRDRASSLQPGDTLSSIAARAGTTVDALAAANGLDPNGVLLSGSTLDLSGAPASAATTEDVSSAQPVGAPAEGASSDPPYPTPETVSASEISSIAAANGVPSSLAEAIGWQESGWNNDLVSVADARGVMQILPGTWDWIQRDARRPGAARPGIGARQRPRRRAAPALAAEQRPAATRRWPPPAITRACPRCSRTASTPRPSSTSPTCSRFSPSSAVPGGAASDRAGRALRLASLPAMFYDDDADLHKLDGKTVAIIGYGSQGHAHALNLKDSGVDVVVGLRSDSRSVDKAKAHGLEVLEPADASSRGDLVMMLVPDELHAQVWDSGVKDGIASGNMLLFGHGFSIHYEQIVPPPDVDVALVAPKGPGHLVRRQYTEGSGVPCLVAVQQDASGDALGLALAYAKGIGGTRGGVIETTFKDETETDLFGEQAVLCGGVTELVRAGYETLVGAGYDPRLAYFECLHELKLIVDLIYEKGIAGMRYSISNTAEYGDLTRGSRVISDATREAMRKILSDIQSGDFAREWIAENRAGQENFKRMREEQAGHRVEVVGKDLRAHMDWIDTEFQE